MGAPEGLLSGAGRGGTKNVRSLNQQANATIPVNQAKPRERRQVSWRGLAARLLARLAPARPAPPLPSSPSLHRLQIAPLTIFGAVCSFGPSGLYARVYVAASAPATPTSGPDTMRGSLVTLGSAPLWQPPSLTIHLATPLPPRGLPSVQGSGDLFNTSTFNSR